MLESIAESSSDQRENPFFAKDFLQDGPHINAFSESIQQSPRNRVIICIHPHFLDSHRLISHNRARTDRFNKARNTHMIAAAKAGRPVLIFEEARLLTEEKAEKHYYALSELDNVLFIPTLDEDPTPMTDVSKKAHEIYKRLIMNTIRFDEWTEDDWDAVGKIFFYAKMHMPAVDPQDSNTYPQDRYLRTQFNKALETISTIVFRVYAQRLKSLAAERIAIGGSKYHSFVPEIEEQAGCVSYAARKFHTFGFPVRVSTFFTFPERPTAEEKELLRT